MVLQQMGETSIPKTRKQQAQNKQPANLLTVVFEVKTFLNGRPGSQQNAELVEKFLTDLATFPLTKAERLQILNLRPASIVELHVVRPFPFLYLFSDTCAFLIRSSKSAMSVSARQGSRSCST